MEEQSSAFFPGSGSGFPQAWALCHSWRGENQVSLSVSIGPRATALWEPCCSAAEGQSGSRGLGSGRVPGLGLGLVLGAGGAGHQGLCCVLWLGHCSWSSQRFLLREGQGGGRSWLRTGKGCLLVCTGA